MDLSNENTIKELAKEYRIEPSALKGQNFLVDKKVLNKIVDSAKINSKDNILEIGPGFGILTKQLIKKSKKLIAVEMDEKIVKYLNDTYNFNNMISIILVLIFILCAILCASYTLKRTLDTRRINETNYCALYWNNSCLECRYACNICCQK